MSDLRTTMHITLVLEEFLSFPQSCEPLLYLNPVKSYG